MWAGTDIESDIDLEDNVAEVDVVADAEALGGKTLTIVEAGAYTFTDKGGWFSPAVSYSGLVLNVTSASD